MSPNEESAVIGYLASFEMALDQIGQELTHIREEVVTIRSAMHELQANVQAIKDKLGSNYDTTK